MGNKWELIHISVIVRDIEKAIKYYESLGIGPFEGAGGGSGVVRAERTVRGKPAPDVKNIEKMAQLGPIKLALVQPVAGNSLQKEWLEKYGAEGIDHIAFRVENLQEETDKLIKKGFKVVQSLKVGDGGLNFFDTDKVGGFMIELNQTPTKRP
ncbi:MAG: VOC family protein [Dehalococcoidales bacterium]|nr:VOC family protein [Dehalococcoidales bacterium]